MLPSKKKLNRPETLRPVYIFNTVQMLTTQLIKAENCCELDRVGATQDVSPKLLAAIMKANTSRSMLNDYRSKFIDSVLMLWKQCYGNISIPNSLLGAVHENGLANRCETSPTSPPGLMIPQPTQKHRHISLFLQTVTCVRK